MLFCAFFFFLPNPNTNPYYLFRYLKAPKPPPQFHPLPVLSSPSDASQRHRVDVHQEADAGRHHHRLRIWPGLHAASRRSVLDKRLEKASTGYISSGLPAHLLYMVGNSMGVRTLDSLCIHASLWEECMNALFVILFSSSPLISGTFSCLCPLFLLSLSALYSLYLLSGYFLSLPGGCWPTTGGRKPSRSFARQHLLMAGFYLRLYRCILLLTLYFLFAACSMTYWQPNCVTLYFYHCQQTHKKTNNVFVYLSILSNFPTPQVHFLIWQTKNRTKSAYQHL